MNTADYDLLIIGGGMVGATLALSLAESEYKIAVVEAHALGSAQQSSYDDRTIALSYGSRRILEQFDLWAPLQAYAAQIQSIHVSDRGHFGIARIQACEENVEALGYVIENRSVGEVLMRRLADTQIDYLCPAILHSVCADESGVSVSLTLDGVEIKKRARLLVAADGANSSVRSLLNVAAMTKDYCQSAIISNVTPQKAHRGVAYERFTRNGPVAFLPMQDHEGQVRCSVVWTLPSAKADEMMLLNDHEFLQRLQAQFGYRLGRLIKAGARSVYPLRLSSNDGSTLERVLFIGNAKQALHPVAGQGFNLALRDVAELRALLSTPIPLEDVGLAELLQVYAENRRRDRDQIIRFTDGLVTLFSNSLKPLGVARGLGLFAVDVLPSIRHRFARFTMGLST